MTCVPLHASQIPATLAFALCVAGTACADEARVLPRGGHPLGADSAALDTPAQPPRGHALGADMAALDAAAVPPPAADLSPAGEGHVAATVALTK